ncbi:caudovirales tail fiber assembly family protein [Escherichia coli]|nr:caudovirales tail fiber assembly family protein [Escherichia coli]
MRKVCAAILSAAICLVVSGAPAWASEHQSTLSAGYLHASTNVPGSDDLNGINVKYPSSPEGGCSWYVQTVAELEIATEEEKAFLAAWKTYRVLLNRVDTVNPVWPPPSKR